MQAVLMHLKCGFDLAQHLAHFVQNTERCNVYLKFARIYVKLWFILFQQIQMKYAKMHKGS